MFTTNSFKHYEEKGDHGWEVKSIMHTSILYDLLKKFTIDYIDRVELMAISNGAGDVYVRVVLKDMSYIAKYSFLSFLTRIAPPLLHITPTIMPHDFVPDKMSFVAQPNSDTLIVDSEYIKKYAAVAESTPFKIMRKF